MEQRMRVLSVTELENVYGGSEASYDAGHAVGEAIVKTAQAVLLVAGLIALAPVIAAASA
jgi:hypothetical protein